jgi:hypothetical protein
MTTLELDDDVPVVEDIDLNIILDFNDQCDNTILNMLPRILNPDENAHLHNLIKAATLCSVLTNRNYLIRMIDLSPDYSYHTEIYNYHEDNPFIKHAPVGATINEAEESMEERINYLFSTLCDILLRNDYTHNIIDTFAKHYDVIYKDPFLKLIVH